MSAGAEAPRLAPIAAVVLLAGSLHACAKNRETSAPISGPLPDDIAAIDARLSANADALRSEGIVVAELDPARVTDGTPGGGEPVVGRSTSQDGFPPAGEAQAQADVPREELIVEKELRTKRKKREAPSRCERICDLAESTCDLRARVCDLARVHDGDVRYADACERATSQCDAAQTACTRCR